MVAIGSRRLVPWLVVCLVVVLVAVLAWRWTARSDESGPPGSTLWVGAYFAPWDESRGLSSLRLGSGLVDEFTPVWYTPAPTGRLESSASRSGQTTSVSVLADEVRARGMRVVPAVSNFRGGRWDGTLISAIVNRPDLRRTHIAALTDLVVRERWDGVDLDYESLLATDRASYAAFIRERHRSNGRRTSARSGGRRTRW